MWSSAYGVGARASDMIASITGNGTRQSAQAPAPASMRTTTRPGPLTAHSTV
jgi:hypothetical protein